MLLFVTCVMELFLAAVLHLVVLLLLLVLIPTFDFFFGQAPQNTRFEKILYFVLLYMHRCMYRSQLAGKIV